jgi:hypothetical protein
LREGDEERKMNLQELATNAEINHWPPHLGVNSDAEKIEYMAAQLREAAHLEAHVEELSRQLQTLEEENSFLRSDNDGLRDTAKKVSELVARHVPSE